MTDTHRRQKTKPTPRYARERRQPSARRRLPQPPGGAGTGGVKRTQFAVPGGRWARPPYGTVGETAASPACQTNPIPSVPGQRMGIERDNEANLGDWGLEILDWGFVPAGAGMSNEANSRGGGPAIADFGLRIGDSRRWGAGVGKRSQFGRVLAEPGNPKLEARSSKSETNSKCQ